MHVTLQEAASLSEGAEQRVMKVYPLHIGDEKIAYGQFYLSPRDWTTVRGFWRTVGDRNHCNGYSLRYAAYFYCFYVLYAVYHYLLCLAEALRLGHPFGKATVT